MPNVVRVSVFYVGGNLCSCLCIFLCLCLCFSVCVFVFMFLFFLFVYLCLCLSVCVPSTLCGWQVVCEDAGWDGVVGITVSVFVYLCICVFVYLCLFAQYFV